MRPGSLVALLVGLMGCGTDVTVVEPVVDIGELPPGAATPLEGCAKALPFASGPAWIGTFGAHADGNVTAPGCDEFPLTSAVRFFVNGVFLDEAEVSNACYRHCVDAGVCPEPIAVPSLSPWSDPSMGEYPVLADAARGATFCAWRGGRLPSDAELARAQRGSEANVTLPELYRRWFDCMLEGYPGAHYASEPCDAMYRAAADEFSPRPVMSRAEDVGPWGHRDLHDSQCEVTATLFPESFEAWKTEVCSLPKDSLAPITFGANENYRIYFCPEYGLAKNLSMAATGTGPITADLRAIENGWYEDIRLGIRCAYDPVPVE